MRIISLLLLFLLLSCTSKPFTTTLMPTPELYSMHEISPVDSTAGYQKGDGILFATSREPTEETSQHPYYTNENAGIIRFGKATVTFKDSSISWEHIQEQSSRAERDREYSLILDSTHYLGYLPESAHPLRFSRAEVAPNDGGDSLFLHNLNERINRSAKKSVTIFIHGFRVDFSYPILIASQLWYYTGLDETFLAFSWPSTYNKYNAYMADSETAMQSGRDFRLLIEYLVEKSDVEEINVIAHSAGTRIAVEAFNQLAMLNADVSSEDVQSKYRVNDVVLLSGDASIPHLVGYPEGGILKVAKQLSIYQSETDRALSISQRKQSYQRIGQAFSGTVQYGDSLIVEAIKRQHDRLFIINATNAKDAKRKHGHSYFWRSPWVSSDLMMLLRYDKRPSERGLTYDSEWGTWGFSDHYPDDLDASLKE